MGELNPNNYRKQLLKKLEESDNYSKEQKVVLKNKILLGEMRGSPLDELRQKLFSDDEDIIGYGEEEIIDEPISGVEDDLEGVDDLGDDELGDTLDVDMTGAEEPLDEPVDDMEVDEVGMDDGSESVVGRNLDDVVSDTILEILTKFKEIRDMYVEEDPQKADIVRKVYDYLFKAKDKIANEINKDSQQPQQQLQQPQQPQQQQPPQM